jgi:hypothetical protein
LVGRGKIEVDLESLSGFMVGTESRRLQAFCKNISEMDKDVDVWKYATL